ncbi:MAG: 1-(5-phosphoribosyl)-5-[(5-phosphoribosylamino)methylideneamino]imidazole-4-carboxamide isomerase [Omnitrophica bacterium GWA2_50_21]|nr:MAG: 1-(5-phosphoribosyl)-5-[(5-phosphoribosylamino)methylideneamino]imidazole-4-carboxamide isomerase [Omnitrophica bacterium GWA2_50_21]
MILIPAIDLRGGKVVRLIRGQYDQEIVYGQDPAAFALNYEEQGAEWLHVVDLDGALHGEILNLPVLEKIRKSTGLKIEFGGGVRTLETIDQLLRLGIDRVILGTKALQPDFIVKAVELYRDKLAVSLDTHQGMVQVQGWTQQSKITLPEAAAKLWGFGIRYLVYTNISKDGMLSGPDLTGFSDVLRMMEGIQVILSGGIGSLADIEGLKALTNSNFYGCIIGRALYEKKFTLKEAISLFKNQ